MKKSRFFAVLLALALLAGMAPILLNSASAATVHDCSAVPSWTSWNGADDYPSDTHVRLTANSAKSGVTFSGGGTYYLDLNGNSWTGGVTVEENTTLVVCSCGAANGSIGNVRVSGLLALGGAPSVSGTVTLVGEGCLEFCTDYSYTSAVPVNADLSANDAIVVQGAYGDDMYTTIHEDDSNFVLVGDLNTGIVVKNYVYYIVYTNDGYPIEPGGYLPGGASGFVFNLSTQDSHNIVTTVTPVLRTGYIQIGWSRTRGATEPETNFVPTGDTTLYPVWEPVVEHTCGIDNTAEWTEWDGTGAFPTSAPYVMMIGSSDVSVNINDGDEHHIHLGGNSWCADSRAFSVGNGTAVTLCDCDADGGTVGSITNYGALKLRENPTVGRVTIAKRISAPHIDLGGYAGAPIVVDATGMSAGATVAKNAEEGMVEEYNAADNNYDMIYNSIRRVYMIDNVVGEGDEDGVTTQTLTESGESTDPISVFVTYNSTGEAIPRYYVDVTWGSFNYVYRATESDRWDPQTHAITRQPAGTWEPADTTASMVKLVNHSNAVLMVIPEITSNDVADDLSATFVEKESQHATVDSETGYITLEDASVHAAIVDPVGMTASQLNSAIADARAKSPSIVLDMILSGSLDAQYSEEFTKIGTVTVTLNEVV